MPYINISCFHAFDGQYNIPCRFSQNIQKAPEQQLSRNNAIWLQQFETIQPEWPPPPPCCCQFSKGSLLSTTLPCVLLGRPRESIEQPYMLYSCTRVHTAHYQNEMAAGVSQKIVAIFFIVIILYTYTSICVKYTDATFHKCKLPYTCTKLESTIMCFQMRRRTAT